MTLQYRFFRIPANDADSAADELNRFLRSVRVVNSERQFVALGQNSFWTFAVEYLDADASSGTDGSQSKGRRKVDYKEVLSPEDFAIFVKLREWRKGLSDQEAVPVYTILTNEQLALIAQKRIKLKSDLGAIDGIGEARVKKYGDAVVRIVAENDPLPENGKAP